MELKEINLGAPAAERDITEGLADYFVESDIFDAVAKGKTTILLGNRGSGKSAILKMLAARERANGTIVVEMAPQDYSYEMLSSILKKESEGSWAKQGAYTAAWKYLIYVIAMKELSRNTSGMKTGSAKKIYDYLRDNFKGEQANPIATLISYLKRLEGIKIGQYEAAAKTQELQKLYQLEEIVSLLPCIADMCKRKHKVLLLVDELDQGWDGSEDAKRFVSGLFHAAISVNQLTPGLRVLIALRQELYNNIPELYEDAQKVRDLIEHIRWDENGLRELIARRIRHSLGITERETASASWNRVFEETLEYRKTQSFNYLVDRTLYRPREMIGLCQGALDNTPAKVAKVNYQIITIAEIQYSGERLKDIAAEYRFQYPGILQVFETFRGMKYTFTRQELENHCIQVLIGESCPEAGEWLQHVDESSLISILWTVGFLRGQAAGGLKATRRSGSEYLGPHQVENLNLRTVPYFHVHPMFRTHLAMKESK